MIDLKFKKKELLEIGRILKSERTRKSISIEKMTSDLMLEGQYVELIEAGEVDFTASHIYLIGYINNIARYLNLDVEFLLSKLGFSDTDMFPDRETRLKDIRLGALSYKKIQKEDVDEFSSIKGKLYLILTAIGTMIFITIIFKISSSIYSNSGKIKINQIAKAEIENE